MSKIRIFALALAGASCFLCAILAEAQVAPTINPAPNVPTPESVLGHRPGDDFYLANYDESREYFHKLAAASNRVKLITAGKTTRGLDWEIAIISSPENLANLDKAGGSIVQRLRRRSNQAAAPWRLLYSAKVLPCSARRCSKGAGSHQLPRRC